MMKHLKGLVLVGLALILSVSGSLMAYAGQWQQDTNGWWYQFDDGSYPMNTWVFAPVSDGSYHYYYFNEAGYMLENTITPDGLTVGADGSLSDDKYQSIRSYVNSDKTYFKKAASGGFYFYKGAKVPDTETFDLHCQTDYYDEFVWTQYDFNLSGEYVATNNYDWEEVETWSGNYKRVENTVTLYPDDTTYPTEVFYIENGVLWSE